MFKRSDTASLELIAKYISDIEQIISRHGSIEQVLDDFESEYAVLMCITQIAETVNKISTQIILDSIETRGILGFRNRMVHNYEGRDRIIISGILKKDIPELKRKIKELLKENSL